MKELYTKPVVTVDEYETVDVIATSLEQLGDDED